MLNDIIEIFFLSLTPIGELRASIPYGLLFTNLDPMLVVFISIIGNVFIGILILYILPNIVDHIRKLYYLNVLLNMIFKRTLKRGRIINNLKYYGLIIFVSIPLPLTGVWTGAIAAFLFGLSKHKSILAITYGVLISSTIVTIMTLYGINLYGN